MHSSRRFLPDLRRGRRPTGDAPPELGHVAGNGCLEAHALSVLGMLEGQPPGVEGRPADISVLEVLTGRFTLTDVTGVSRLGERAIVPSVTVKDGRVFPAGRGAHPWGFAPPPAAN